MRIRGKGGGGRDVIFGGVWRGLCLSEWLGGCIENEEDV